MFKIKDLGNKGLLPKPWTPNRALPPSSVGGTAFCSLCANADTYGANEFCAKPSTCEGTTYTKPWTLTPAPFKRRPSGASATDHESHHRCFSTPPTPKKKGRERLIKAEVWLKQPPSSCAQSPSGDREPPYSQRSRPSSWA